MEPVGARIRLRSAKRFFGSSRGEHALEANIESIIKIEFVCQEKLYIQCQKTD
ncbi:hypothetical protein D1AOALGA4SA_11143 [Olavius algarvensis Delta 1 endosymbiont]|nr:hypothetical protein D1AOALGA4SA_11143 [Olavius algarvensis Delta 1 endosymbiont]